MVILTEEQEAGWIASARPDAAELLAALQMTGARFLEKSAPRMSATLRATA